MATKAKSAAKLADEQAADLEEAQAEHNPATLPSDSGARQPDVRSAAARATNAFPGTEIETSSGPQEVGATRGARRPYTETLPGTRRHAPAGLVPTEEEQKAIDQRKKALADRAKQDAAPKEGVQVVATRMGFYGGKRRPAGSTFVMHVAKGVDVRDEASWVEPLEDMQQAVDDAAKDAAKANKAAAKASADVL